MLSIDITDKQMKIVRGSLSGSKIRVVQVDTRDVPDGSMDNGFITDIPMLASELADLITSLDTKDKEAICCINSGMILYKELVLPRPKKLSNTIVLENMIQNNMNISTDYNISYQIVGETTDENNNPMIRVMATACPQRMVDGYIRLFGHVGLTLKSIYISNNCISRLVTTNAKMVAQMPLLLVQVDENFLNINLYDNGQTIISRYVNIDKSDYNYDDDYIYQAVNDNIFHMVQFIDSRPDSKPLKEMMFYGRIPDFIRLTNAISSYNIPCHMLAAPASVVSFCELDFAVYANAIGALMKTHKDYDQVNLLRSVAAKEKKPVSGYFFALAGAVVLSCGAVAGAYFGVNLISDGYKNEAAAIRSEISGLTERSDMLARKISNLEQINMYSNNIFVADQLFKYMPKPYTEVVEMLEAPLVDGMSIVDEVVINQYSIMVNYHCEMDNMPSEYVEALSKQGYFENIIYTGYTATPDKEQLDENGQPINDNNNNNNDNKGQNKNGYDFTLTMLLKGGNAVELE